MSRILWSTPARTSVGGGYASRPLAPSLCFAPRSLQMIQTPTVRIVSPLVCRGHTYGGETEQRHDHEEGDEISRDVVVRSLLIDNYDSYTYNIYQELSVVNGVPPMVIHNDEWTWEYAYNCLYNEKAFDNIVISPGPGRPSCPADVGICHHLLSECKDVPILGVCLGHQALGFVHGAQIIHAPEPIHGRLSEIEHTGSELFKDIPSGTNSGFKVVRYHSLVIDAESLPEELIPIAWTTFGHKLSFLETPKLDMIPDAFGEQLRQCQVTSDLSSVSTVNGLGGRKILMGIRHSTRPHYGVQFHPESIATSYGRQMFMNFKKMTVNYGAEMSPRHERKVYNSERPRGTLLQKGINIRQFVDFYPTSTALLRGTNVKYFQLQWKKLDSLLNEVGGSENIFLNLFGDHNLDNTFWLDSSSIDKNRARFSFMGGRGGSLWKQLTFHLSDQARASQLGQEKRKMAAKVEGYLTIEDSCGSLNTILVRDGLFDFLDKELNSYHYDKRDYEGLPFDFCCGFIGYLGCFKTSRILYSSLAMGRMSSAYTMVQ